MANRKGKYHPLFFSVIRPLILIRDFASCVVCYKQDLSNHVHHVDGNKQSVELDNFVVLCQRCHNSRIKLSNNLASSYRDEFNSAHQPRINILCTVLKSNSLDSF